MPTIMQVNQLAEAMAHFVNDLDPFAGMIVRERPKVEAVLDRKGSGEIVVHVEMRLQPKETA